MKGWKTWTAAIGAFGTGVAMIVDGLIAEPFDPNKVWQGILACVAALAMVGIGHKIDKLQS